MGPEAKLYKKFKKATPTISYSRIENLAVPGVPDALGYTKYNQFFTIEFQATSHKLTDHRPLIKFHGARTEGLDADEAIVRMPHMPCDLMWT